MEYFLTSIKSYYMVENEYELTVFLSKYPEIKTFLIDNINNFKNIVKYPIILSANLNPPCDCTDQEEDLLWLYINGGNMNEEEAEKLEDEILKHILSPNWFKIGGRVGTIVI